MKDAAAQGATVRTAGRIREADADAGGYFVLPTVVTGLAPDSALASEEQFGPVLPIFGYDAIDDAVAAANATEFGLTASVWTGDDALADKVTGQLIAGTVSVNCHGMAAQDPRIPFGGVGQSGLGRELGADGIRAFTQPRGYVRQPAAPRLQADAGVQISTTGSSSAYGPSHLVVLGGVRDRRRAPGLDRAQADRIAGPALWPGVLRF